MFQRIMHFAVIVGIGVSVTICGFASCSNSVDPTETGTLRLVLTDAPTQLKVVDSLEVVFERVLVHRSSSAEPSNDGWFVVLSDTLPEESRTFDLLQLVNGVFTTLGEVELETGRYTQIRIILQSATLFVDGVPQDLSIPSGTKTGIKLVNGFIVEPNATTELAVDFDVARSLHENPPGSGDYVLRPTMRLVQTRLSGTISGTVTPTGIGAALLALSPASGDTVTATLADPASGAYVLPALPAGTYDVQAQAVGFEASTRPGIKVVAGADTPDVDFELVPRGN